MAVEEHVGEPHPFSKSVPDKELSSTEPKSDSCIKDNGVKDQVVNTSDIELHINDPTTNSPIKDKDQQPIKEGQQPIDDGEKIERSTVQSSIINSSDGPIDYKALQKVRKTARSEEVSSKEKDKQRYHRQLRESHMKYQYL